MAILVSAAAAEEMVVPQAEAGLMEAIRVQYREAVLKYEMKDYAMAQRGFQDCYSLYQASAPHLSNPDKLEVVRKGCEHYLQGVAAVMKRDAALNGLQAQLTRLELDGLHLREVDAGTALEMLRRRIGELLKIEPPAFIVQMPAQAMSCRITLELDRTPALYALQQIAERAGAEIRFERHAVVFSPLAKVDSGSAPAGNVNGMERAVPEAAELPGLEEDDRSAVSTGEKRNRRSRGR
jgi:hypothetical protein